MQVMPIMLSRRIKTTILGLLVLVSLSFLGGCASTNPRDPLEPMNRAFYSFNDGVDNALLKPIAEGYRAVNRTRRPHWSIW